MNKSIFVCLIFLFSAFQLPAGNAMTDSLLRALDKAPNGGDSLRVLRDLSRSYMDLNLDSTRAFTQQLFDLSTELEDIRGRIWALQLWGGYLNNRREPKQALQAFQDALLLAEELDDPGELASVERAISGHYLNLGQVKEARQHLERGAFYFSQIDQKTLDHNFVMAFAFLYQRLGDFDAAEGIYHTMIERATAQGNRLNRVRTMANLGLMYKLKGDCDQAIATMKDCLPLLDGESGGEAFIHAVMGGCYRQQGNAAKGLYHHLESYKAAVKQNSTRSIADAAEDVSQAYEMAGNTMEALRYLRIKTELLDSLRSIEFVNDMEMMEQKYKQERTARIQEKARMTEQIRQMKRVERQRWIMGGLALGFVLILLLLWRLARQNRRRKEANTVLERTVEERTQDLSLINSQLSQEIQERKRSETELNTFVYRSSHDIKGPLTSIKGLLDLAQSNPELAELQDYLSMMELKVEHLDDVLERLIEIVRFSERELEPETLSLSRTWKAVLVDLQPLPGFEEVSFEFKGQDLELAEDKESIHIVLRNLAANALHFRDPEKGICRCTLEGRRGEEGIEISLRDNGVGMTEAIQDKVRTMFYRGNLRSKGTGLGLFVVEKIVRRIGGKMEMSSEDGIGTTLTIYLPV